MKIAHVCLASSFTENMSYQDNLLSYQNLLDGHEVTVISNCRKFSDGKEVYAQPEDRVMDNGIRLIRLEYDKILTPFISSKIRKVSRLYPLLKELNPDVILFHGVGGWELLNVAKYKKEYSTTELYVDSHEDFHNSARNIVSKYLLHKLFNRIIVKKSLPYIEKVLYVSMESKNFCMEIYGVPDSKLEFFPLGGIIFPEAERNIKREKTRNVLKLANEHILCVHSGKMDKLKRTADIINAFSQVKSDKLRLLLIGNMTDEVKKDVLPLINADSRIAFVGWKTADELLEYLCAADIYVQPGGQSATMQNAICCGCAMILFPHKSHEPYLQGNGYYVKTVEDMREVFEDIVNKPEKLPIMRQNSMKIAQDLLDYKKLAARLYQ